jgi:metallophosphoesterase (TIGR00282 family)
VFVLSELRILAIGDVVGRPGRHAVREIVPRLRRESGIGFVVANAENCAGGAGVTLETAREILDAGVDVLTTGDHFFDQKEFRDLVADEPRALRPANWSHHAPGRGHGIFKTEGGVSVGVVNLIGRVFMNPFDNPFDCADDAIAELRREVDVVIVDLHAEATSEKIAMGWYLDRRVSLLFGTHTHVQTADERVLPGGTAYITDLGMTGPHESVLGREIAPVLTKMRTGTPAKFGVGRGDVRLKGVIATVEAETGRATGIERVDVEMPSA